MQTIRETETKVFPAVAEEPKSCQNSPHPWNFCPLSSWFLEGLLKSPHKQGACQNKGAWKWENQPKEMRKT